MKYPIFKWDNENKICICDIKYNNLIFSGTAKCHPDDQDMVSELTGGIIAELRANIKCLCHQRDCEIKPKLQAIRQVYYSINQNQEFNPKSFEAKAIFKHMKFLEKELKDIRLEIKNLKLELKTYIALKEEFYQEVRRRRNNGQDNLTHI